MTYREQMGPLNFDPNVGTFVSYTELGDVDSGDIDIWELEYTRMHHEYVRWEPSSVPHVGVIVSGGSMASGFIEEEKAKSVRILVIDGPLPNDGFDHYVDLKTMTVQPKAEPTTTLEGTTLRNFPPGSEIVIDDAHRYPIKARAKRADLSFDQPGTYRVVVESPTQKDAVFTVEWTR